MNKVKRQITNCLGYYIEESQLCRQVSAGLGNGWIKFKENPTDLEAFRGVVKITLTPLSASIKSFLECPDIPEYQEQIKDSLEYIQKTYPWIG